MSDEISRDYRLTVRLSVDEKAQLDALTERLGLDMSATVRKALQLTYSCVQPLPANGHFVPLDAGDVTFPIRLSGKGDHDR